MNSKIISEKSGLPISTIRYYEKIGLLPPPERGENNYRHYTENHLNILLGISFLTNLNFPLSVIQKLFSLLKEGSISQNTLDKILAEQEKETMDKIEKLKKLRQFLEKNRNNKHEAVNNVNDFGKWLRKAME